MVAPSSGRCCKISGVVLLLSAILLLLMGIWATHLNSRFTPIYTDITCEIEPATLGSGSSFSLTSLSIQLISKTTCQNPNPYSVLLKSKGDGQVYAGSDREHVATITDIPSSTLPAKGSGSITAIVDIPLTGDLIAGGLSQGIGLLTGHQIPVYIENDVEVVINIGFFFGSFKTKRAFDKDCGMNVLVKGLAQMTTGPMACADDWDKLQIPDATGSESHSGLTLSAEKISPKDIEEGKKAKDIGLGLAMGIGYGLGGVLLCLSVAVLAVAFRKGAKARSASESQSEKPTAPEPEVIGAERDSMEHAVRMEV